MVTTKTHFDGKKAVWFVAIPSISNPTKAGILVVNSTPLVATIDAQDEDEIVIAAFNDEVNLIEEEFGNLLKDAPSED